jgi:hypothetical protein
MLSTPWCESDLEKLVQDNDGPAVGLYQMERRTFTSLQDHYLSKEPSIKADLMAACHFESMPGPDEMIHNLRFATIMARIQYWQHEEPLPKPDDIEGMYRYYKKYYNTPGGDATPQRCIPYFKKAYEVCARAAKAGL